MQIDETLKVLFEQRDEIPLFYVESGSRLWDIASPDSDFDVRGFHLQSRQKYFDFRKHRDIIEVMDGDFDLVSYDIDKMFGLLAKCNPTVFEWIRAHICYFNILPDWEQLQQEIITNYDLTALYYHYLSLANGQLHDMEKGNKFTYKKAFYCIRGLLSADLAAQGAIPQLRVEQLLAQTDPKNPVTQIARDSLDQKRQGTEKQQIEEQRRQAILTAIHAFVKELSSRQLPRHSKSNRLAEVLTEYCVDLKSRYY